MVQSLLWNKKFFVLFVLDPIIIGDTLQEVSFAARNGCLVFIENVSFPILNSFQMSVEVPYELKSVPVFCRLRD